MPIEIKFKDGGLMTALNRLAATGADTADMLEEVGAELVSQVSLCFDTSRDPYGDKWKALAIRDGQPLMDKGLLRNSINHQVEGGSVIVGTNLEYAAVHQFGAVIEPKQGPTKVTGTMYRRRYAGMKRKGRLISRQAYGRLPSLVFRGPNGRWYTLKKVVIPARPFLPDADRGLPKFWADSATKIIEEKFSRSLGK